LRQACQDFESFLLLYLFREMRKTAEVPGGALPSSSSSQILRDLSEETAVQQLVAQLHCGLADLLYSALKSNVGVME
jgi:Rod binding domain-containing protein